MDDKEEKSRKKFTKEDMKGLNCDIFFRIKKVYVFIENISKSCVSSLFGFDWMFVLNFFYVIMYSLVDISFFLLFIRLRLRLDFIYPLG